MPGGSPITVRLQDLTVDVALSGVAQGDLLIRGADKWQNLPAGTSGYFLKSNGAGANPSWASVSLSPAGENGQIQYNAEGAFAGAQGLKYQPRGSIFTVCSGGGTDVPLTVDCPASQSGNLLNLRVNGTNRASVTKDGALTLGVAGVGPSVGYTLAAQGTAGAVFVRSGGNQICFGTANFGANIAGSLQASVITFTDFSNTMFRVDCTTGHTSIGANTDAAQLYVLSNAAATIGSIFQGATSQSGNLSEWQSVGGSTVYGTVSENGYFTTRKVAAPDDAELSTSELAFWFDATAGAAKLKIKAKNASGTVVTGEVALA